MHSNNNSSSPPLPAFIKHKKFAILGLGRSNLSVIRFLCNNVPACNLWIWDDNLCGSRESKLVAMQDHPLEDGTSTTKTSPTLNHQGINRPDISVHRAQSAVRQVLAEPQLASGGQRLDNYGEVEERLHFTHPKEWPLSKLDAIIISPGISLYGEHPHYVKSFLKNCKAPVMVDLELFYRFFPTHTYIGITGTNGKSTLTTFLQAVLQEVGENVVLAGNIGYPIFDFCEAKKGTIFLVEASSFQLSYTSTLRFHIAVLTNIFPNHDNFHGGFNYYCAAKANIFKNQTQDDYAIVDFDEHSATKVAQNYAPNVLTLSARTAKADFFLKDGKLYQNVENTCKGGNSRETTQFNPIALIPEQNKPQGIKGEGSPESSAVEKKPQLLFDFQALGPNMFSFSAGKRLSFVVIILKLLGVTTNALNMALPNLKGLPHRQELVGRLHLGFLELLFINDSKATTPQAAAFALSSFKNIYWLVGGIKKSGSLKVCVPYYEHVKEAFVFGPDEGHRQEFCSEIGPSVAYSTYGSLKEATLAAVAAALSETSPQKSATSFARNQSLTPNGALEAKQADARLRSSMVHILLSPIGTSFDSYQSFESRGEDFRQVVARIINYFSNPERALKVSGARRSKDLVEHLLKEGL